MKTTAFLLVLFLFLSVSGEKTAPDFVYKAAAQICKPHFLQCRKQSRENKIDIRECFQNIYYKCIPAYRNWIKSVEQCAADAGLNLEAVINCSKAPAPVPA